MKFKTVRNLMLSMLVIGVAGSIVGVGSGTFSLFNAVTTSESNTFTSASVTFSNTTNGGTCTSTAGAAATTAAACTASTSYTGQLATMVPGDSKTMTTTLTNGGNVSVTVTLGVAENSGSNSLTSNGIGTAGSTTAGTDGLGLLVFECRTSGHADVACGSGTVAELYVIYGSCGNSGSTSGNATVTQAGAFTSANVTSTGLNDNGVKVGTSTNGYCYAGDTTTALAGASIPIVGTATPTVGNVAPMAAAATDNLAMIMYLPTIANNNLQNISSSSLNLTWTASQIAGTSH